MVFWVMTSEILPRLVCSIAKKHHARLRSILKFLFEVRPIQGLYLESVLQEVAIKSSKGTLADLVRDMEPQVEAKGIILKLETLYVIVASLAVLMQSFYKISQDQIEKIPVYTIRIEETLNQIRLQYLDKLDRAGTEGHLRGWLFHGIRKGIRNSLC